MQFRRLKSNVSEEGPAPAVPRTVLDVQNTLLSFPGPALLVNERLETLAMNKAGELLSHLASLGDEQRQARQFREGLREAAFLGMPTELRIEIPNTAPGGTNRSFDVCLLPCKAEPGVGTELLLLGREITVDQVTMDALVRSRELYRDLLRCSSDFAWETDRDGVFRFVSERGAAGYRPEELNGLPADDLVNWDMSGVEPADSPFHVSFPVEQCEIWMQGSNGTPACLLVSAVPIHDSNGVVIGTRGACVDVTELRAHERAVAEAERRRELVETVVQAIREEFEPDRMLQVAANEIAAALSADLGGVLTWETDKEKVGDILWTGEAKPGFEQDILSAVQPILADMGALSVLRDLPAGDRHVLFCGVPCAQQVNGGIVLFRQDVDRAWTPDEQLLLRQIGEQMGIVFSHVSHVEALEALSRIDPMTRLLNRRAFYEDATTSLTRHQRAGAECTYVYLDMDDFKRVNDTMGHGVGDQMLIELSNLLHDASRAGDLVVRLGGDEFGLLLDQCGAEGAIAKVETIFGGLDRVRENTGIPWPVSVSAGIAVWQPGSDETVSQLMDRADKALYQAKGDGKKAWRVSAPQAENKERTCLDQ